MKKNILASIAIALSSLAVAAGSPLGVDSLKPKVGKPIPNFTLNKIIQYKSTTASYSDFKGKWLFLDFWYPGCTTCAQNFPKVNSLYKEFRSEIEWVTVGLLDAKYSQTNLMYERHRKGQKLEMPAAYDSLLFARWGIHTMPYVLIVDPEGIVRFITNGKDITSEKIQQLLNGEPVTFDESQVERNEFTEQTERSDNLLLRSILTKSSGKRIRPGYTIDRFVDEKHYLEEAYSMAKVPLYTLYTYAYVGKPFWDEFDSLHGKFYNRPILELSDSSLFDYDFTVGKGTYNYLLDIPSSEVTKERLMSLMQGDLKRAFKYEVTVESRMMSVWKLRAKPGAIEKLRTKGGERYISPGSPGAGYTYRNVPFQYLLAGLSFYLNKQYREPFIDETGINFNIDFSIDADMTTMDSIQKAIREQGLEFVKGQKEMKAIVVKDPKL